MALRELSKRKPNLRNRIEPEIEKQVVEFVFDHPAYGQLRVSNELRKKGTFISSAGVRSVWFRNDPDTFKKRLKALEAKVAQEG